MFGIRGENATLFGGAKEICVSRDKGDVLCVTIDRTTSYKSMSMTGPFFKKGDNVVDIDESDVVSSELISLLVGEIRNEAKLRRVGKLYLRTNHPGVFRILKRVGWSTAPESKVTVCYDDVLLRGKKCSDGFVIMRQRV